MRSSVAVLLLFMFNGAFAQNSPEIASLELNQPHLIQYLKDGRHDAFQTIDVAGLVYPSAVYIKGINLCRNLRTKDIPASEISILSDPKRQGELIGLNANAGDIMKNVLETARALSFHGQGQVDSEQVIRAYGCDGNLTVAVVGTAEAIIMQRLEDKRKRQQRRHEERVQMANWEMDRRQKQQIFEKNFYDGKLQLNQEFQNERAACGDGNCRGEVSLKYRQDFHILETGLQYSPAYNVLVYSIENIARRTGKATACGLDPIAEPRAEVEAIASHYYSDYSSDLLEIFDAARDKAYEAKMVAFDLYDWETCPEEVLANSQPFTAEDIKRGFDQWAFPVHGLPGHQAH